MLKIVKVARFSDIYTTFSDIICIFAAEINNSLKNGNFLEMSRLTYESISKI